MSSHDTGMPLRFRFLFEGVAVFHCEHFVLFSFLMINMHLIFTQNPYWARGPSGNAIILACVWVKSHFHCTLGVLWIPVIGGTHSALSRREESNPGAETFHNWSLYAISVVLLCTFHWKHFNPLVLPKFLISSGTAGQFEVFVAFLLHNDEWPLLGFSL